MNIERVVPALLVVAAVATLLLVALFSLVSGQGPGTAQPSTVPGTATATPASRLGEAVSYVGPSYGPGRTSAPTVASSQSKLWFGAGSWWGILLAESTGLWHIHELDWDSQRWVDTGVVIDERPASRMAVSWDGATLTVAGAGASSGGSHALRVQRFGFDLEAHRYVLESDFPRVLTTGGTGPVSLAVAGDGSVWIAWTQGDRIHVSHGIGDGQVWPSSFTLPVPEAAVAVDAATIVSVPGGVMVVWTNADEDRLYAAAHRDADAADAWSVAELAVSGLAPGPDQLSARGMSDGALLVVLRTSLDRLDDANADAPQLVLARLVGDEWTRSVVARVQDGHDNPYLVVDEARNQVHVLAEADGDIYRKAADLDTLRFAPGLGTPALLLFEDDLEPTPSPFPSASASAAPAPRAALRSVTSTSQGTADLTELVIIAANDADGRYQHAVTGLPGGRSGPDAAAHLAPPPEGLPNGLPPGATTVLVNHGFSAFELGSTAASGWFTRSPDADALLSISEATAADRALRITAAGDGGTRACRNMPTTTNGRVIVTVAVQAGGAPQSDATITTLRSTAGEVASVRFGETGTFRYFVGNERVTSPVEYETGVWYLSVLELDLEAQTYDWRIGPLGGSPTLTVGNVPVRVASPDVREVCMQSASRAANGAAVLWVDDIRVESGPND